MKKRKKICELCGDGFIPTRIDAKYCSSSCRSMSFRARENPQLYEINNHVHLEINEADYAFIKMRSKKGGVTVNQFSQVAFDLGLKYIKKYSK